MPRELIHKDSAILPPDQAHHLRHVLRLRNGDRVEIFDGEGSGYSGVVSLRDVEVRVEDLSCLSPDGETRPPLILAAALIKADRLEWVLQKGTELGVDKFILLETRFCDVPIPKSRISGRLERWNRLVREASKQSCRFTLPRIAGPMTLERLLSLEELSGFKGLFFYEGAHQRWDALLPDAPGYVVCTGPEGGWHPVEADAAAAGGFSVVNLGPRVLRAETAAVAAVSLVQFRIADCGLRIADSPV